MTESSFQRSPSGSQWHRWDPHIHTPGTILEDSFRNDWAGFCNKINNSAPVIRALGITDYCSIETYRKVRKLNKEGELPNVQLVFPNVELRFDVGTSKGRGINLHLLFSPDDPMHEDEIERILGELQFSIKERTFRCTRSDLIALGRLHSGKLKEDASALATGVNQFKVNFQQLRNVFKAEAWLQNNCLVAVAASQGDGLGGLQDDASFGALRDEMQRFAHIIMSGKPSDRTYWLGLKSGMSPQEVERRFRTVKPCIHGSDAHSIERVGMPDLNRYCWIKGDLCFESLRQIVIEPDERVLIGDEEPARAAASVTIEAIELDDAPWFAQKSIPLNPGLVAVIGARGSGKTALADLISVGANAMPSDLPNSSFLKRATSPNDLLGTITVRQKWADGRIESVMFPPDPFEEAPQPSVCYLSQQFVERLCSSEGLGIELRKEVERVIYEQTDPTERYDTESFDALYAVLLDPVKYQRHQNVATIEDLSQQIAEEQRLQDKLPRLKKESKEASELLEKERKDLKNLLPKGKEDRAKKVVLVEAKCAEVESKVEALRRKSKTLDNLHAETDHVRKRTEPNRFTLMKAQFAEAELSPREWESFRMIFSGDVEAVVKTAKNNVSREILLLTDGDPQKSFDPQSPLFKDWPLARLRSERDVVKKEVGLDAEKQKKFYVLKRQIAVREKTIEKLLGQMKKAEATHERLGELRGERRDEYEKVFESFGAEENILSELYKPLQQRISESKGSLGKLCFSMKRHVDLARWINQGEELLDLRSQTRFRGHGALRKLASESLLSHWRSGGPRAVANAMNKFLEECSGDIQRAMPSSINAEGKPEWLKQVGNWLFSTSHISIQYSLEYDGVAIEQLSPGTRGIVLLLLYLAIDTSDRRPLIIDQPEENLDPQSVYNDLVPQFREARRRRQVIIVTHNANLVVNTDADQVIVASAKPNGKGGLPVIDYAFGSLENAAIRFAVCDILEGGERAFLERERRYRLHWDRMLKGPTQ